MKKTAGFLKFLCTLGLIFEVIAIAFLALALGALIVVGSFSELAAKAQEAISISGNLTPAEMDALKPFIIVALATALISVVFAFLGTKKEKAYYTECTKEHPFSEKSVDSLMACARLELIGGIVGVIGSVVLFVMGQNLKINGASVGNTSLSLNLTFLIYAVQKYFHYHVADYGHSLENR